MARQVQQLGGETWPTEDGMKEEAIDEQLEPEQKPTPLIILLTADPAYEKAFFAQTWDQLLKSCTHWKREPILTCAQ